METDNVIKIHLKDPDGFNEAIRLAVEESVASLMKEEQEVIRDIRRDKLEQELEPWVEYQEYITLEFNREKKTLTVVKRDE